MPLTITAMPDNGSTPTSTEQGQGWLDAAWAWVEGIAHTSWPIYVVAGLLALLLALSIRSRAKRTRTETAGGKAALTRTDRIITRITGILATAVVATGAWKVFGLPALDLPPAIRVILFFFAEAQIIAAWRRVRRHIHRHAILGPGTRTIYLIAFGSATVAAFDASGMVEVLLRFFAALVAAYMIAEELAEELDIHLTAHPELRTADGKPRGKRRIKWALTLERVLVWLRLAEPSERTVEEVERQRRIARFARTAYRLQVLKEAEAAKWRIGWARWSLRRQTEAGNEHLNLAGDQAALGDVRSHLALLYGAEAGTSRDAVADLSPLRPIARQVLNGSPSTSSADPHHDSPADTQPAAQIERAGASPNGSQAAITTANGGAHLTATTGEKPTAKPAERPAASPANGAKRPSYPFADDLNPSMRALAKAYAKNPTKTNAELARQARVSEGTANRYLPKIRAAAIDSANADADEERAQGHLIGLPISEPKELATAGVNGNHFSPEETTR